MVEVVARVVADHYDLRSNCSRLFKIDKNKVKLLGLFYNMDVLETSHWSWGIKVLLFLISWPNWICPIRFPKLDQTDIILCLFTFQNQIEFNLKCKYTNNVSSNLSLILCQLTCISLKIYRYVEQQIQVLSKQTNKTKKNDWMICWSFRKREQLVFFVLENKYLLLSVENMINVKNFYNHVFKNNEWIS